MEQERKEEALELYKEFTVDPGQSPLRIDKFLSEKMLNVSRSRVQNACDNGWVLVNEKQVKSNHKVKPGQHIKVFSSTKPPSSEIIPQDIPLDIVYEDDYIMLVNKEPGMVVHPGNGNPDGTLVNAVAFHWQKTDEELQRIGLVHRIDKYTSGLLLFGKDEESVQFLADQFKEKTAKRKYIALVWGPVEEDEGTIDANIGRDQKYRTKYQIYPDGDEGKTAITHYKVIERFGYTTLIECTLETGRTHQIRVHMKSLGHPLFNDETYGGDKIVKGTVYTKYKQFVHNAFEICPRQALHAKTLGFIHPHTKKEMHFDSELPEDISSVAEKWRKYIRQ